MASQNSRVVALSDMVHGQESDLFVLMTVKEELKTREGKPYYRVAFRDAGREVGFPIWDNSPWAAECRESWNPGIFYKIRATYRDTSYGPQLEIRKMFCELLTITREKILDTDLQKLTERILLENRSELLVCPAAKFHHHAFLGGLLEHVLSVTRTAVYLADRYDEQYPDMKPPLDKSLVVAGAILHDIGKLRELELAASEPAYTPAGELIGHLLLGRDMVRDVAVALELPSETLLRLEHLIIAHQRLPEWGSPKPPMTPEALIVHYADDLDAKYFMMYAILRDDGNSGPLTSSKNVLRQRVFRGGGK
jgi:3'-5' exoribonuclease